MTLSLILIVFAFVFEAIAVFWNPQPTPRWNLIAAGLACYFLSLILAAVGHLL